MRKRKRVNPNPEISIFDDVDFNEEQQGVEGEKDKEIDEVAERLLAPAKTKQDDADKGSLLHAGMKSSVTTGAFTKSVPRCRIILSDGPLFGRSETITLRAFQSAKFGKPLQFTDIDNMLVHDYEPCIDPDTGLILEADNHYVFQHLGSCSIKPRQPRGQRLPTKLPVPTYPESMLSKLSIDKIMQEKFGIGKPLTFKVMQDKLGRVVSPKDLPEADTKEDQKEDENGQD